MSDGSAANEAPRIGSLQGSLSMRRSTSIDPAEIEALFDERAPTGNISAPPLKILIHLPQSRKDASGQKFSAHPLITQRADGGEARTERRYTEFVALHDEVRVVLALPTTFPVPAVPSMLQWMSGTPREEQLQQYVDRLLDIGARRNPLPTLTAFCGSAPYVAVGTPSSTCLSALPSAAPSQCLPMMRAHSSNEAVLAAGAQRLLELSRGRDDGMGAMLVDAGAVEFLCEALRWIGGGAEQKPSAPDTPVAAAPRDDNKDGKGRDKKERRNSAAASPSRPPPSSSAQAFTAAAVGTLAALATSATSNPADVRALLRRCGANELLTNLMKSQPQDVTCQSGCAALIAALVAADHHSPPGLASHFDFMAVELVCLAMLTHRSKFEVQWHGCAALHALSCRADALAEAVVRQEGVRILCKAMSTYRSDTSARLQASACGAMAALADRVPSARRLLADYSAGPLIGQTLADFLSASDGGAAVFVCGARAVLTLSDLPPASTALLQSTALEELMWSASTLHEKRLVVQGVCCEVIAALMRERVRLAAAGTLEVGALHRAGTVPRAVRFVASTLARHASPHLLDLTSAALDAAIALTQMVFSCQDVLAANGLAPLAAAADMQSLEVGVQRAAAMMPADDPLLQGLAVSARVEFERWSATFASSFGRRQASPPAGGGFRSASPTASAASPGRGGGGGASQAQHEWRAIVQQTHQVTLS